MNKTRRSISHSNVHTDFRCSCFTCALSCLISHEILLFAFLRAPCSQHAQFNVPLNEQNKKINFSQQCSHGLQMQLFHMRSLLFDLLFAFLRAPCLQHVHTGRFPHNSSHISITYSHCLPSRQEKAHNMTSDNQLLHLWDLKKGGWAGFLKTNSLTGSLNTPCCMITNDNQW